MSWTELAPVEVLADGFAAPRITDQPWLVRWDKVADIDELMALAIPSTVDMYTSGTTGPGRAWRRSREQLWAEAGLLAELLAPQRPQAIMSFAPPRHVFGALVSVLVPARLRVPVWYRPGFLGAMPHTEHQRWAIMATPWIFSLLLENMSWVRDKENVTVLHSTAMLPATAGDFLARAGNDRARVLEVFGSTETGGVATRRWTQGNPPWELFDDVSFASSESTVGGETPLAVRSPRLAATPGERPPATRVMDDFVEPVDDRRFRFVGRRSRLVKVNGRRINLDELEHSLRSVIACADLAIVPVSDTMIGEHIDLLVVPENRATKADIDMTAAISHIGIRPRRITVVDRIDRSETGKLRRVHQV